MNRFTVDFSSSLGSEHLPSNGSKQQSRNVFSVPDDIASTTPAAPPPSQMFGSSQFGTGISKLQLTKGSNTLDSSAPHLRSSHQTRSAASAISRGRLFETSTNTFATEEDEEDYSEQMMSDEESDAIDFAGVNQRPLNTAPSLLKFSTNSMKQSQQRSTNRRMNVMSRSRLPRKGRFNVVPGLATDLSRRMGIATLTEPDDVILSTEDLLRSFDNECQKCSSGILMESVVSKAAHELVVQWKRRARPRSSSAAHNTIGPDTKSPPFEKAQYLAEILLLLHHPDCSMDHPGNVMSRGVRNGQLRPMPEVLLDWLDENHVNYDPLFDQVIATTPAPSANELYWDAIETFTLRGKFQEVMELLRRGDLNYATIDTPEGIKKADFVGTQLQKAEDAVYRARQLINTCPALQSNDWNLDSQDWDVYRRQLETEIEYLADQVDSNEGLLAQQPKGPNVFEKQSARSGLPFVIYQRLKTVYSIMLGDADEIIGLAQDWIEASVLLTVWWNPVSEKSVAEWSFDVSKAHDPVEAESSPYLQRLSESFMCVTDPDSDTGFQLNTMDPVEIGLGAALQGDIQSCLRILQSLSLCAASAVAEIGTWAGWIASATLSAGLDQDDLMVLNYGSDDTLVKKDDILELYAQALFGKDVLHSSDGEEIEGWELSFSILSRLDDQERMHTSISEMLSALPVTDQQRTAKLVDICEQFGLESQGRKVSENFADSLMNETTEYGTALLCYARAHAEHKVRKLTDLLNSYCLVQSKAYPPEDELDSALAQLVSSPKSALQSVADADPRAAEILQFYLVGYACLRRFYSLRDEQKVKGIVLRPLGRKKAAAKALVAAINSAADSIYGGLYDSDRQSAIQIDGLLTMLGECTAFLSHGSGDRVLSSDQMYALLAAIEDLQTVSDRIYQAAEECMEAALRNYHGSLPPSPHAMLKKSVSSGTNSNFSFSMMGSDMLARSEESLGVTSLGSEVMVRKSGVDDTQRGWDWRAQFKDSNTKGRDVLGHLRLSIARELSMALVEEGNSDL